MAASVNPDIAALVSQLSHSDPDVAARAARAVKNAIIANPTNKRLYLRHGVLSHLITAASRFQTAPVLAEHSVAALGSLASHLNSADVPLVISALTNCLFCNTLCTVYAAVRSLKLLVCSTIDVERIASAIIVPLVASKLVSLLSTPDEGVAEVSAVIIAYTVPCKHPDNDINGNINYYARVYNAADVIPSLVALLTRTVHERCTEATINALTELARRLDDVCLVLTSTHNIMPYVMPLIRTPIHSLRLATCRLLTNFHFANRLPPGVDASVTKAVVTLLAWNSHSALDVAAQTLAELVNNSKDLQRIAKESGAVIKLADIILADHESLDGDRELSQHTTSEHGTSSMVMMMMMERDVHMSDPHQSGTTDASTLEEDEEKMSKLLRFSALSALSALTLSFDPARDAVIEKNLLPVIVDGLADDSSLVVEGSISCIRSLSRSVKILREKLSEDEVIGRRVVALLNTDNQDILRMATAALCNLVLEFSPVRKVVLEMNGIKTVIDLLKSRDEVVRKNCVWVLKNLLFKADMATKSGVLSKLDHESLRALFTDDQPKVRSLAMTVVRNLACPTSADTQNEQLDALFSVTGVELISMLSAVLNYDPSSDIELVIQALYVVCNIASGTEQHKAFLLESDIPQLILKWTCHPDDRIRIAAVWCTINLSWRDNNNITRQPPRLGRLPQSHIVPHPHPFHHHHHSSHPHRRHLRVTRRALRGPNRSGYESRLQMMLRQQHLPLPASPTGRRILEQYAGAAFGAAADVNANRLGSASSDGGNDDMWLFDRDAAMNEDYVETAGAGDIDGNGTQSESNESNANNNNNEDDADDGDDDSNNNNTAPGSSDAQIHDNNNNNISNNNSDGISTGQQQQRSSTDADAADPNAMQTNENENDPRSQQQHTENECPSSSGYEASGSGSGGVDGSAGKGEGEGDHSGSGSNNNSNSSGANAHASVNVSNKSCGYEWRIERLRQLGFEGRLRSLVNDPHIEVQGRARAALQLFDCNDINPLDYSPSSLLIGSHAGASLPRNNHHHGMFHPPS